MLLFLILFSYSLNTLYDSLLKMDFSYQKLCPLLKQTWSVLALALSRSDQSRKVGTKAKLMLRSGCHWSREPPSPIQPTQPSSYTLSPPWLNWVGITLQTKTKIIMAKLEIQVTFMNRTPTFFVLYNDHALPANPLDLAPV